MSSPKQRLGKCTIRMLCLVITARVANNNVHRLLVDDDSAVDIIYLDAYKRIGLTESKLILTISPLYGSMGDHVIPRGTVKLAVTVGEHPRVSTIVTEFLIINAHQPSMG